MNETLDELFRAASQKEEFILLDNILTEECETYLLSYKGKLSVQEYENIRDAVFSISYQSKRGAFKIGFKTAVRMFLVCVNNNLTI